MKLLIEISGTKILVTPDQLDTIVNTLNTSMVIENKYVSGKMTVSRPMLTPASM